MNDKIKCPNCSHLFDVEDALSGQMEAKFQAKFEEKIAKQAKLFQDELEALEVEKEKLSKYKEHEKEIFEKKLEEELLVKSKIINKETQEQFEQKLKSLEDANEKKTAENRVLRAKEIELSSREKELKEQQEEMQLTLQKQLLEQQNVIEEKARVKEREKFELEKIQLLKQIEDNKKLAEEMKRKAEQGSMQMQGEVQELALESLLKTSYPFDEVAEVGKGIKGADCIQTVINATQQICGTIVYESKRTKTFGNDWIDKLKQDQVSCKADIAVLVTETMPKEMDRFGEKDGVWVCAYNEIKSLSFVLRQMLLKVHVVKGNQENKGEKMELLYRYLTGTEFSQNISRIVENYDSMMNQLNTEKKRTFKSWSEREKQIWSVQENLSSLFGSIKGIAGNAIMPNNTLELLSPDDSLE